MSVAGKKVMLTIVIRVVDKIEAEGKIMTIHKPGTKITCVDSNHNIYDTDELDENLIVKNDPGNNTLLIGILDTQEDIRSHLIDLIKTPYPEEEMAEMAETCILPLV